MHCSVTSHFDVVKKKILPIYFSFWYKIVIALPSELKFYTNNMYPPLNNCYKEIYIYCAYFDFCVHKKCIEVKVWTLKCGVLRAPYPCSVKWLMNQLIFRNIQSYWVCTAPDNWYLFMQNFISLWYTMCLLLAMSTNFPDNPRMSIKLDRKLVLNVISEVVFNFD